MLISFLIVNLRSVDAPEMVLSCRDDGEFYKKWESSLSEGWFWVCMDLNVSLFEFNRSVMWIVPQALEDNREIGLLSRSFQDFKYIGFCCYLLEATDFSINYGITSYY